MRSKAALHSAVESSRERRGQLLITVIKRIKQMLWTIFVILLILWLLGMVTSTTLGGFIHLLLIIAIAVVLIRIIQGRRPV